MAAGVHVSRQLSGARPPCQPATARTPNAYLIPKRLAESGGWRYIHKFATPGGSEGREARGSRASCVLRLTSCVLLAVRVLQRPVRPGTSLRSPPEGVPPAPPLRARAVLTGVNVGRGLRPRRVFVREERRRRFSEPPRDICANPKLKLHAPLAICQGVSSSCGSPGSRRTAPSAARRTSPAARPGAGACAAPSLPGCLPPPPPSASRPPGRAAPRAARTA
jgi:hypothetical protein